MNSKFEKYEFLFPKRVYRCPCLQVAIDECFINEDFSFADIARHLWDLGFKNVLSGRILSAMVGENMEHCLFTCSEHLKFVVLATDENICTKTENDDNALCFDYLYKKEVYCRPCLIHYMKLLYSDFYFVEF